MDDLKDFNTQTKSLIKQDEFSKLFVTEDANAVMDQFEKEKETEVERELGSKVTMPDIKRGWNEWAGSGVVDKGFQTKIARAEKFKADKIAELKQKR